MNEKKLIALHKLIEECNLGIGVCNKLIKEIIIKRESILSTLNNIMLKLYCEYEMISSYDRVKQLIENSQGKSSQRTADWYAKRNSCITASAVHDLLCGTDRALYKFIQEKCGMNTFFTNKYVEWGNKYEDIAVNIFEHMYDVQIYNAPLLLHEIYPFIGASCDGFVIDEKNKEGYLIEIKCPYSRVPHGSIPVHYYEQPQVQSNVTYVKKCAFFDCQLGEYLSEEEMWNDNNSLYRGLIIKYTVFDNLGHGSTKYFYSKKLFKLEKEKENENENLHTNDIKLKCMELKKSVIEEFDIFCENEKKQNNCDIFLEEIHYWYLKSFVRDDQMLDTVWLETNYPKFKYIWNIIEHYKPMGLDVLNRAIDYFNIRGMSLDLLEYEEIVN